MSGLISLVLSYLLCIFPILSSAQTGVSILSASSIITTVSGTGETQASDDGISAQTAALFSPYSVAFDKLGNLYIAEYGADRIRKIDVVSGIIETVAGTGMAGSGADDIGATDSDLYGPTGMSFDTAGNMYIADCNNHKIRKVDVNMGMISTIAGNGESGYSGDGGLAINALLNSPVSMVVDKSFNVYIADTGNNCIRRVNGATGSIKTYADGSTSDTLFGGYDPFFRPSFVTIDAAQNVYIADEENHCIRKVDAITTVVTTVAGICGSRGFSGDGVLATKAKMLYTSGVAVDSFGNIFISDMGNHRIRMVNATSKIISTVAGTGASGYNGNNIPALTAAIKPLGMAVDKFGNIFIADKDAGRVRSVLLNPTTLLAPSASPSSTSPSSSPTALLSSTFSTSPSASDRSSPSSPRSEAPSSPIAILPSTTTASSSPSSSPSMTMITSPSSLSPSSPVATLPSMTTTSSPSLAPSSTVIASPSSPTATLPSAASSSPLSPTAAPTEGNATYAVSPSSQTSLRPNVMTSASLSPSSSPSASLGLSPSSPPSAPPSESSLSLSPTVSGSKVIGNLLSSSNAGYSARNEGYLIRNMIISVAVGLVLQWVL